ncbi:MAG: hypothetical protein E6R04_06685 [Spirochaetes bacterium]|nr:MAG: hypothetical protein E6R04_06685 [Spirochaetota bacterium]
MTQYRLSDELASKESEREVPAPVLTVAPEPPVQEEDRDMIAVLYDSVTELKSVVAELKSTVAELRRPKDKATEKTVVKEKATHGGFWEQDQAHRLADIFSDHGVLIKGDPDHLRRTRRLGIIEKQGLPASARLECHDAILTVDENVAPVVASVVVHFGNRVDSPTLRALGKVCHTKIVGEGREIHVATLVSATNEVMSATPSGRSFEKMAKAILSEYDNLLKARF